MNMRLPENTPTFKYHLKLMNIITLVFLIVSPMAFGSYALSLMTRVLIFGLFAMSLDILVGYTGLVSFNHATFFGISGYTAGILITRGIDNFWVVLPAGIIAAAAAAVLLGPVILRSRGPYFLMITLAFGQMIFALVWKWRSLTGGDDGLPGVSRPETGLPFNMWENRNFYYFVLFFFFVTFISLWKLMHSHPGRSILGVRESESRMQALGYNTWMLKYLSYILAGGVAGLAGVLHVYYTGFISPQELNWTMSGFVMLMVIIGGAGTLIGPVIGAAAIIVLQNVISSYTERWPLFMGILFIVCVMYARNGIAGYLLNLIEKGRKRYESSGIEKP